MSSRNLPWAVLVFATFTCVAPSHVAAYCRMTTNSEAQIGDAACVETGAPFFWRNPCLSYAIDSRGSRWMTNEEVEEAVGLAFETWENVNCGGSPPNLIFTPLGPSTCRRPEFNNNGNVNTIAFLDPWGNPCADVDDDDYRYEPFALAVTIVWRNGDTGEILDVDMMINDQLATRENAGGPYANCPDTGCPPGSAGDPGPSDLRSIVTHEIGHFIGIGHSNIEDATMYWKTEQTSVSNRTLAQDDIDAVCDIYPPGSLDQFCNATPLGGLQLNCETDDFGEPLACDGPASLPGNSGGCSASRASADAPWAAVLMALFGLSAMRRRPRRRHSGPLSRAPRSMPTDAISSHPPLAPRRRSP